MALFRRNTANDSSTARKVEQGPIGLDLGLEQLNLVQLQRNSNGEIAITAKATVSYRGGRKELLGSPKRFKALVREALGKGRFQGKKTVSVLPSEDVRIISVSYQKNGRSDDRAILDLLTGRVEGSLADYVVDYLPVRASGGDEDSLAVVALARKDVVLNYLDLLEKAGLDPQALEIGPAAIRRLVSEMSGSNDPETVLVINFGREMSYLTMISGRRLLFDQEVEFGEERLLQLLSESLDISSEMVTALVGQHGVAVEKAGANSAFADNVDVQQAIAEIVKPEFLRLVKEISRALVYAASETRGKPTSRIYLLGGIARWPGADQLLSGMLELPVSKIPDPLRPFRAEGDKPPQGTGAPEIAVATGLALRGVSENA